MRAVVGLDLSLTGTGVCIRDGETTETELFVTKPERSTLGTWQRLASIASTVCVLVPNGSLVCVEGPSYGSRNGHQHDRSGLWWLVVSMLYECGCTVIVCPPTSRAMYATGKGNAPKDAVLAAMIRKHPELDITNNNVADAVALCDIASRYAGQPVDPDLPQTHTRAMKGISHD